MARTATCPHCGKEFAAGVDGMLDPLGCDKCLGVERVEERSNKRAAWLPGQTVHYYLVDGKPTEYRRPTK
jgi:hypothetical protein